MILQEGQPALTGIPAAVDSPQVSSHGSLGDDETQFQEFSVNLGCTPSGILLRHLADQDSNLLGDLRPAATWPRFPTPIQPETGPAAQMAGAEISQRRSTWKSGKEADRDQVNGALLAGKDMHFAMARKAFIAAADLRRSHLEHADFEDADLRWSDLRGATLAGT